MTNEIVSTTQTLVQVVLPNGIERVFPLDDIRDQLSADVASVSDSELVNVALDWLDIPVDQRPTNLKVTRPSTGNILISEEFRYG